MTQHYSLEPQVHRQNKGWIQDIPVGISVFFFFKDTLRQSNQRVKRKAVYKNKKRHFLR